MHFMQQIINEVQVQCGVRVTRIASDAWSDHHPLHNGCIMQGGQVVVCVFLASSIACVMSLLVVQGHDLRLNTRTPYSSSPVCIT
jgi:hypothetical protein